MFDTQSERHFFTKVILKIFFSPCAVAIDVGGSGQTRDASIYPEFNNYKSGIYTVGCSSAPEAADHAVVVVGYGTSTAGVPYWIIRCA